MSEEFWSSEKGVLIRIEDLAHDFTFQIYNGALRGSFKDAGFRKFRWATTLDGSTCRYCWDQNGREYNAGMFLPRMPAHPKCRCLWDILISMFE
jgi:hypothetical protein